MPLALAQQLRRGDGIRNEGIASWIRRRAIAEPDRRAVVFDGETRTYAQLAERALRLAHGLRSLGVARGDRVGYIGANHPAFLEALFASATLGAVFVPVLVRRDPADVDYILRDAGCAVVLSTDEAAATIDELRRRGSLPQVIAVDGERDEITVEEMIRSSPSDEIDEPVTFDDLAFLAYTSGTTGAPKGAMLTHGNVTWNAFNLLSGVDFVTDDVTLATAPMTRVGGLNVNVMPTLFKGGTVVVMRSFDAKAALRLVEEHRVTVFFANPDILLAMRQAPNWTAADLASIRVCITGGAPVPERLIRTYLDRGVPFVQGYGLTEASPLALLVPKEQMLRKIGAAGVPPLFTDVRIVRADMSDVSPGEIGEVIVRGPNVMRGYWNRPHETGSVLVDGWLRTGDAARVDDDGYVYIVDRLKDAIVVRGRTVFPAEIEAVLSDHPAVGDAAVIGVPDSRLGERPVAFVALTEAGRCTDEELLRFCSARLAEDLIPSSIEFVPAIPRNAAQKILRTKLRDRLFGRA